VKYLSAWKKKEKFQHFANEAQLGYIGYDSVKLHNIQTPIGERNKGALLAVQLFFIWVGVKQTFKIVPQVSMHS